MEVIDLCTKLIELHLASWNHLGQADSSETQTSLNEVHISGIDIIMSFAFFMN